jgi:GTP-binding protein
MPAPLVAIVGRPNVGKSSLFNRMIGKPVAIVDPTPGTTRDRIIHRARREGWNFDLIDTGGIGIVDAAKLEADVYQQVERAIKAADRIIFMVDGRAGVLGLDSEIAQKLRPIADRVVLAVNKLDHEGLDTEIHQYHGLGLGDPVAVSATAARGLIELCERLFADLPAAKAGRIEEPPADDGRIKLCLAGRRNVGKSSLTNALCGEERVIVADFAGTTRDAVDVPISTRRGEFMLIDTAGLRKKNQIEEDLEFYAACRTERAIKRCDVVLLVLDASDEVGIVDKKLAHFCEVEGKPTVLVVNKWDIAEKGGASRDDYTEWLRDRLPGLKYAPVAYTCALTGYQLDEALKLAAELYAETKARITTSALNELVQAAMDRRRPKRVEGQAVKVFYGTQVEHSPPTFVMFVNRTDWLDPAWARFMENFLRERLPFPRIPIRIKYKARDSRFHEHADERLVVKAKNKAGRSATLVIPRGSKKPKHFKRRDER